MQVRRPIFAVAIAISSMIAGRLEVKADLSVQLNDYTDARYRYDRFYSGGDRQFIGESIDWSGIGRATVSGGPGWATMISPSFFCHRRPYRR
jgi:hypothetical protein